ncbi:LysR family transcriptional regulator [Ancylobacter oerskovii]|uniref:LysR substrate-binding domain-containing protein n=1 Tax=Ancylobacter oerskovii TaxID=459519 RepID=A0ABW4YY26_9HYPH|nr:LysR family transcriptional regulator [Ancylobacter oerskovii]MBS7541787.1 LysR family transcriptional regulator [Ancylobacter oerskovii]
MDRLTSMEVFAKVAEAGSFSAAADAMGISGPMVGKHIRLLEEHLGVRLLNRTTRRQSLTDAGKDFLERTRIVLAELEAAEAMAAQNRAAPRGELRINAPFTFGTYSLAPVLPDFMAQYPDVTIRLNLSDRLVDLVDEGYDCVFRIGRLSDSTLIARGLRPQGFLACASTDYLRRQGVPSSPEDLVRHDCLGFAGSVLETSWRFIGASGEVVVPIKPKFSVNSGQALRQAALAGSGIILQAAELLQEDIATGGLTPILSDWLPATRPKHLLFAPDRRITPKLRAFIDFAVEQFG